MGAPGSKDGQGGGTGGSAPVVPTGAGGGPVCFTEQGPGADVTTGPLQFRISTHPNELYPAPPDDHHEWRITHCLYPDGHRTNNVTLVDTTPPPGVVPAPPPALTATQLALRATAHLHLRFPTLHTSPPGGNLTAGLPTWVWVDSTNWRPQQATDSDGALAVTLTATPSTLTYDPGDGTAPVDCHGPGTPYVPGRSDAWAPSPTCGHTFTHTGPTGVATVTTRTTLTWTFAWRASDGSTGTLAPLELVHTAPATVHAYTATTN